MPQLHALFSLHNDADFARALKSALEALSPHELPLQRAIAPSSYVGDAAIEVSVLRAECGVLEAKVGVFFTEIAASCGCGDEPMVQNAYCELQVRLEAGSGDASFEVLRD